MPAYITPIEHTRSFSVKPADGLRYGNFEGVVHLPPVLKTTKLGEQSFSTINNQQIYKTVCDWYDAWRPWQQRVLLCGIVDRCTIRQVDILATSLEPIRHRDYTVAAQHNYPTTPLKKLKPDKAKRQRKKKAKRKLAQKLADPHCTRSKTLDTFTGTGAESPVSVIEPGGLTADAEREISEKLRAPIRRRQGDEDVREFSLHPAQYGNMEEFADVLATRIIDESIPKTVSVFEPSELYAQDLASSILQQALDTVVTDLTDTETSLINTARLDDAKDEVDNKVDARDEVDNKIVRESSNEDKPAEEKQENRTQRKSKTKEKPHVPGIDINRDVPDLTLLDKYKKFKSPRRQSPGQLHESCIDRPKSMVRILVPDGENDSESTGRPNSGVSKSLSMVTRSSLGNMRYKLFGARSLNTPDYFKETGATQLEGGMLHLRQGNVRRPWGLGNVPVAMGKMYKSIKWWGPDSPREGPGKILFRAHKADLTTNFKEQLAQVFQWLLLWEDYEKISLLKELLKMCGAEDLNFLGSHLQQKLRDTRDFNRMPDKLLLYIFSFLPAEEMKTVQKVCRRWRYLCAMDDLWMVKCHELGVREGIQNLEKLITRGKGYRMVVDWRMAYEELKRITDGIRAGKKKKPKPIAKGRTVEFKEELERLKKRDDTNDEIVGDRPRCDNISDSFLSDTDSMESDHPRFEFRNRIVTDREAPRGSLSRDELHNMLKRMLFEPEEAEKEKADRKGTPVIVELEVHRGTLSAIRRETEARGGGGADDDGKSVVSEDLGRFDDEYKLIWDQKPESKLPPVPRTSTRTVSVEGPVEMMNASEDRVQDKIKRMNTGLTPAAAGPPILRRRKEVKMADEATGDDAAYDIRPDLHAAPDILGKTRPQMTLQWYETKERKNDDEEEEDEVRGRHRFVGEVKSILRARKLQGHMSGITCVQFDHRRLISAGLDRVIRMWDIRSGRSLHKFYGHKGGIRSLSYFGNELATGSWDTTIMIWDLRNLTRRLILTDHSDSVSCLIMGQEFLVSGSEDCTVRVWRRTSYLCCNVFRGHKGAVTSIAFDGTNVISASRDKTLRLTNVLTGECLRTFTDCNEHITYVMMKGSLIISGDIQGHVYFWNKLSGECEAAIQAHDEAVTRIAYLDSRFYTASADWSIKEWDLVTMTSVRLLQGHKGTIRDLKVTSDRIVSCSDDGSIRIWDLFDPRKKTTMDEQIHQLHQHTTA